MLKLTDYGSNPLAELRAVAAQEPYKALKVYLAGPMRGYPEFNFPAFHAAAAQLRKMGFIVWSPAENDEKNHGKDFSKKNPTGDTVAAAQAGFSLREALGADLAWITAEADGVVLLPGWENSKGAKAEKATAEALSLRIWYYNNGAVGDEPIAPASPAGHFPDDSKSRKEYPVYSGVLQYFPDAIAMVARVSFEGNKKHNPGQPLHWSRGKSDDHHDTVVRHLMDRGKKDPTTGLLHSANAAWRALAICQLEIEADRGAGRINAT